MRTIFVPPPLQSKLTRVPGGSGHVDGDGGEGTESDSVQFPHLHTPVSPHCEEDVGVEGVETHAIH